MRGAALNLMAFALLAVTLAACWGDEEASAPRNTAPTYFTNNNYYFVTRHTHFHGGHGRHHCR